MLTRSRGLTWVTGLFLISIGCVALAQESEIKGSATVRDGDDVVINGHRIRLFGIDAFELNQRCVLDGKLLACGRLAKRALEQLVENREVRCVLAEQKLTHDRPVMRCYVGERELNREMVMLGLALDCPAHSKELYKNVEEQARQEKAGAWAGTFTAPWQLKGKAYCCASAYPRSFCP